MNVADLKVIPITMTLAAVLFLLALICSCTGDKSAPPPPSEVLVTASDTGTVKVTWSPVPGAKRYVLEYLRDSKPAPRKYPRSDAAEIEALFMGDSREDARVAARQTIVMDDEGDVLTGTTYIDERRRALSYSVSACNQHRCSWHTWSTAPGNNICEAGLLVVPGRACYHYHGSSFTQFYVSALYACNDTTDLQRGGGSRTCVQDDNIVIAPGISAYKAEPGRWVIRD